MEEKKKAIEVVQSYKKHDEEDEDEEEENEESSDEDKIEQIPDNIVAETFELNDMLLAQQLTDFDNNIIANNLCMGNF